MPSLRHSLACLIFCLLAAGPALATAADIPANPDDYLDRLRALQPGDTLLLAPGEYTRGLPVHRLAGTATAPIRIRGAVPGIPPRFLARPGANTVSIVDAAHVEIADLELDGRWVPVDAVKCEGHARFAHHITLERLLIRRHGANQQIVGISTKCPAWHWVIRGNEITGAGTGMYLGNSDGNAPFVAGLIEGNVVTDTIGYNLQIKHQNPRPRDVGLPDGPSLTVIRRNVFSKARNGSTGDMARPNVLVGHLPPEGPGASDRYLIHGNLFHDNPTEALFQGEGHVALYNNVFVNRVGSAVHVQPHNAIPGEITIFANTILAAGNGIRVKGADDTQRQRVWRNVVFAQVPIMGVDTGGNVVGSLAQAATVLRATEGALGTLDLRPQRAGGGAAPGPGVLPDAERDFCGTPRTDLTPGAFAAEAPAVTLALRRRVDDGKRCRFAN